MRNYPMNGPSLEIQAAMEHPRKNKKRLRKWAKNNKSMRDETLAICFIK